MKHAKRKIGMGIILLLIVVVAVGYVILRRVPEETYAVEYTDPRAHWATITGSVSYPSEYIPPMGVCAESKDGEDLFCTYQLLSGDTYEYQMGYEIQVPPGTYNVFAHEIMEGREQIGYVDEYPAYYSKFVTCGLETNCKSHKPIDVKVAAGEVKNNIDPMDWYNY